MTKGPLVHTCTPEEYAVALSGLEHTHEAVSFLQAPFYGAWQERDGKTVVYFAATEGRETVAAGLAVKYDAPGGISFFYCPYGPIVQTWTPELLDAIRQFFASIARANGATFVRIDSRGLTDIQDVKPVANYLAATASLQPRAEWVLDISGDQEAIWMGMHKHARYNVRLAERAGAKIEFFAPGQAPFDTFYNLLQTTAERDTFSLQSQQYYKAALQSIPDDSGFMAVCTIDGKTAAASIFAAYDDELHYVFSSSSNDFRKIAPPYFVIWNTIIEARRRGWIALNFGGVADSVKSTHLAGVTGFKKRFGGHQIDHTNPVDLVYKPLKYALFSLYKRLR